MPKGVWSRPGRTNWTEAQALEVREAIAEGRSYAEIGKRIGRTANAIEVWTKRNIDRVRDERPMSARDVHRLMGIALAGKWCESMIRRGWIKAERGLRGRHRTWIVREEALFAFLENPAHWHRWKPERITVEDIREWATELRGEARFLTVGEVAARYAVVVGTVNNWIALGRLRAVRWGNWLIPESALTGFVPGYDRPKGGYVVRRFTAEEDARLIALRANGETWAECEYQLKRSLGSCAGRYARLMRREITTEAAA